MSQSNSPNLSAKTATTEKSNIRILVVDDQPIIIESIRRLVASEEDLDIYACSDPTLALATASELEPSLILQDLVMPEVDGLMLVKFFRAHPKTKDVPIIMLSSKEDAKIKAAAFSVGANDYLVKLPDPIELVARMRYHATAYQNLLKRDEAEQTMAQNKALERRVEERTAELQKALNELKQAQAKIVHTEKMNSMGQLVAGIAHEVNNPINFIYGNLNYMNGYVQDLLEVIQLYQTHCPQPNNEIEEKLEDLDLEFTSADLLKSFVSLRSGAKRIRNLVLSLRNFSRFDEAEVKRVNIHEGLESTLAMLSSKLEGILVEKQFGDLPLVECYAGQLNQTFMHIMQNAIEAVQSNNSGSSSACLPPKLTISTELVDKNKVAIWIADNGPGIDLEIQDKIFDPFFTTKDVGGGAGLGLSISHQIVAVQHGGSLKCYSVPGQGTKFLIELPIAVEAASPQPIKKTDPNQTDPNQTDPNQTDQDRTGKSQTSQDRADQMQPVPDCVSV